jgi:type I restriction enzyme, S subunit
MEAAVEITTAVKNVPALRFPEFEGEWMNFKLGSISKTITSGSRDWAQFYSESGDKFIRMTNLPKKGIRLNLDDLRFVSLPENSSEGKRTSLEYGDILISITAELGKIGWVPRDLGLSYINQHVALVRLNSKVDSQFIAHHLSTNRSNVRLNRLNDSGAKAGLNLPSIRSLSLTIPSLLEQQKIASFLSAADDKIQQLSKKKALMEKYKKGVMQQLFSQQIRFKDDNGNDFPEWEVKKLGEVAKRITLKNKKNDINFVLTNSATQGIVSQQDYFDKDIANQENLEGYYVVDVDDFVYNPRISTAAPVGPIKRNKLVKGVMSPLYTVFRFENQNLQFIEFFFETTVWYKYMKSVANYGARHDRMSITNDDLLKLPLPLPCKEEQQKITAFLSGINNKLNYTSTQLEQAKQFKKGLLQQLFV